MTKRRETDVAERMTLEAPIINIDFAALGSFPTCPFEIPDEYPPPVNERDNCFASNPNLPPNRQQVVMNFTSDQHEDSFYFDPGPPNAILSSARDELRDSDPELFDLITTTIESSESVQTFEFPRSAVEAGVQEGLLNSNSHEVSDQIEMDPVEVTETYDNDAGIEEADGPNTTYPDSETSSAEFDPDGDPTGWAARQDELAGILEMNEAEARALRWGPTLEHKHDVPKIRHSDFRKLVDHHLSVTEWRFSSTLEAPAPVAGGPGGTSLSSDTTERFSGSLPIRALGRSWVGRDAGPRVETVRQSTSLTNPGI